MKDMDSQFVVDLWYIRCEFYQVYLKPETKTGIGIFEVATPESRNFKSLLFLTFVGKMQAINFVFSEVSSGTDI